jgi:cell division septum initiation protein DivIVA
MGELTIEQLLAENEQLRTRIGELEHKLASAEVAIVVQDAIKSFPEGQATYMVLDGTVIGVVSNSADCEATATLNGVSWEWVPDSHAVICKPL